MDLAYLTMARSTRSQVLASGGRYSAAFSENCLAAIFTVNSVLTITSAVILFCSRNEQPTEPLRGLLYYFTAVCLLGVILVACKVWRGDTGISVILCAVYIMAVYAWWWLGFQLLLESGGQRRLAPLLYWYSAVLVALFVVILFAVLCLLSCLSYMDETESAPSATISEDDPPPCVQIMTAITAVLIIISVVILLCSMKEEPTEPLRLWIYGYIVLCLVQVAIFWLDMYYEAHRCAGLLAVIYLVSVVVWWVLGSNWLKLGSEGASVSVQAPLLYKFTLVLVAIPVVMFVVLMVFQFCYCCCICCCDGDLIRPHSRRRLEYQF